MQKIVLITGASSGIGKETAILFASQGNKVYGVARNIEPIVALNNPNIIPLKIDVTNSESIQSAIKFITEQEDRLDVLVNNAGFAIYKAVEETTMEEAKSMFNTNVFGLAEVTKASLPLIKKSADGRIINISSVSGKFVNPFGGWYCATKFALEAFSDALRMELSLYKIKVIVVEPGQTNTNYGEVAFADFNKNSLPAYVKSKDKFLRALYFGFKTSTSPKKVARVIYHAANSWFPKARYTVTIIEFIFVQLIKFIPDFLKDFFTKLLLM